MTSEIEENKPAEKIIVESEVTEDQIPLTSYSSIAGNQEKTQETKILPSSYQLRFGSINRRVTGSKGNRYGLSSRDYGIGTGYDMGFGGTGYETGSQVGYKHYGYRGGSRYAKRGTTVTSLINKEPADIMEITPGLISTRAEEKATLGSLNDRFVTYIEKVRTLLNRNQTLESKIKQLERSQTSNNRSSSMYEAQLHKLQNEIEAAIYEKTEVELKLENVYKDLEEYKRRLERESEECQEAKNEAKSLVKSVDQATLIQIKLENKIESLRKELDLLKRSGEEDIRALTQQLMNIQTNEITVDGLQQPDLSEALRDMRAAYQQLSQNSKLEIETHYQDKIQDLTAQLKTESNASKTQQAELIEMRRQVQNANAELEEMHTSYVAVENQIAELEDQHQNEISNYQSTIAQLEKDLAVTREKFQTQMVDYNQLLNLKCSLDLEIRTYRKLLDQVENRISITGSGSDQGGDMPSLSSELPSMLGSAQISGMNKLERKISSDSNSDSSTSSDASGSKVEHIDAVEDVDNESHSKNQSTNQLP